MKLIFLTFAVLVFITFGISVVFLESYSNLTSEKPIALVIFHKVGDNQYKIDYSLEGGPFVENEKVIFYGDQWSIEARVFKLKYFVNAIFGIGPKYRLDRLSSRFSNIKKSSTRPPSVIDLSQSRLSSIKKYVIGIYIYDTSYGSGTYAPMSDGASYQVFLSPTGLLIRPANSVARNALEDWQ